MVDVHLPEDSGPGNYTHRDGLSVEQGETVDVDADRAAYLVEEWDFEYVDGEPVDGESGNPETCDTVKSDGEVCGRELPCAYHSDEDADEATDTEDVDAEED